MTTGKPSNLAAGGRQFVILVLGVSLFLAGYAVVQHIYLPARAVNPSIDVGVWAVLVVFAGSAGIVLRRRSETRTAGLTALIAAGGAALRLIGAAFVTSPLAPAFSVAGLVVLLAATAVGLVGTFRAPAV